MYSSSVCHTVCVCLPSPGKVRGQPTKRDAMHSTCLSGIHAEAAARYPACSTLMTMAQLAVERYKTGIASWRGSCTLWTRIFRRKGAAAAHSNWEGFCEHKCGSPQDEIQSAHSLLDTLGPTLEVSDMRRSFRHTAAVLPNAHPPHPTQFMPKSCKMQCSGSATRGLRRLREFATEPCARHVGTH